MTTSRLEAFSDGVLAIVITIMVLEFETPESISFEGLLPLIPKFLSYLVSFIYLGIYWNNHHHMFQVTKTVNAKMLWANLHLLFWLSLIPFTTAWVGDTDFSRDALIMYGLVLFMSSIAFYLVERIILKTHGEGFILKELYGSGIKLKISLVIYTVGIIGAFFSIYISIATYVIVAIMWFYPDGRLETSTTFPDDPGLDDCD